LFIEQAFFVLANCILYNFPHLRYIENSSYPYYLSSMGEVFID
jgi:hypothetical protein